MRRDEDESGKCLQVYIGTSVLIYMTHAFNDFDFLIGQWKVRYRQFKHRLLHCRTCEEFTGRSEARKILGGFGLMEEHILFDPHGSYRSMSVFLFDVATKSWRVWWYDGRMPAHRDALSGRFEDGTGVFVGDGNLDGTSTRVRYVWTGKDDAPRCEHAVSMNAGDIWETMWVMDFSRIA
jgi:hypothetical protein